MRIELNKLESAGLLLGQTEGQKVVYRVNKVNPFYSDLVSMVSKYMGFNDLIENVLEKVGNLKEAYVVGDYAKGVDSGTIELVLVGDLHATALDDMCKRVGTKLKRKIEYRVFTGDVVQIDDVNLRLF